VNALITGASRGIGRALAEELARDGWHLILCARGQIDPLADAERHPLDVSDCEATARFVRDADARSGGLDLIVANAGVGAQGTTSYAWETIAAACHTNFCGAAATLTAALPAMVARGRGHLVAISSLASFGALPAAESYCAPKAGLSMLLDCLRIDLRGTGVAVTTVNLGFVRTGMTEHSTHPMPQLLDAGEAARRIVRRLRKRPATIDLPQPLALATRLYGVARKLI
jgi:short-subunit dehydrogenase